MSTMIVPFQANEKALALPTLKSPFNTNQQALALPSEHRNVPIDLLPVETKKLDLSWAERTFCYARFFSTSFTSEEHVFQQELQSWIDKATALQNELKEIGVLKANEKVVEIFNKYEVCMPGTTNVRPTSFDDVLVIINDKTWYQNQQELKRNLIHMVSYGIFRTGHNNWAKRATNEWLLKHNVTIQGEINTTNNRAKRKKKGFVYSNLVHRASNSIADRIQKNMVNNHGEFIAVRKKKNTEKFETYKYEPKQFNQYGGYIVYPQDKLTCIMTPKQKMYKRVVDSIHLALQNSISFDDIEDIITTLKNEMNETSSGKCNVT